MNVAARSAFPWVSARLELSFRVPLDKPLNHGGFQDF
jgi:hypothetical protein